MENALDLDLDVAMLELVQCQLLFRYMCGKIHWESFFEIEDVNMKWINNFNISFVVNNNDLFIKLLHIIGIIRKSQIWRWNEKNRNTLNEWKKIKRILYILETCLKVFWISLVGIWAVVCDVKFCLSNSLQIDPLMDAHHLSQYF